MKNNYPGFFVLMWCVILSCTTKERPEPVSIITKELSPVEFIDIEPGVLEVPTDITVLENGDIAVLDYSLKKIVIFDSSGEYLRSFGGEGKGPGESMNPISINKSENYIFQVDANMMRINQFDTQDGFIASIPFKGDHFVNSTLGLENGYVAGSLGEKGSLIKKYNLQTDSTHYFGNAKGGFTTSVNLEEARQQLAGGEIPEYFLNQVKLVLEDSTLISFVKNFKELRFYSLSGTLNKVMELEDERFDKIFENASKRAQETSNSVLPDYTYLRDMYLTNGHIYLFFGPVEGLDDQIMIVDKNDLSASYLTFEEKNNRYYQLAVQENDGWIYFTHPSEGKIYRAKL